MYSGKKAQHDFPKMRGGSKAVWNFSKNSSVLETPSVPKGGVICNKKIMLQNLADQIGKSRDQDQFFWRKIRNICFSKNICWPLFTIFWNPDTHTSTNMYDPKKEEKKFESLKVVGHSFRKIYHGSSVTLQWQCYWPTYLHLPTNLLTRVGARDAYASKNRGRCANIAIDNVVFFALWWAQDEMPQNVYSFPLKALIFLIG